MKRKRLYGALIALLSAAILLTITSVREHSTLLGFRTTNSDYQWWTFCAASREGLPNLRASGSGVIHEKALASGMKETGAKPSDIYVLDLSRDAQLYANGRPWRWFNWLPAAEGVKEPYAKGYGPISLKDDLKWFLRRLVYPRPADSVMETEQQVVERLGYHYQEFMVNKRHIYPPETIDRFINFVENLPENAWLHFHCDGGNSRTTTMLIIYDILRNGNKVPLDTIIQRQWALGGVDINDTTPWSGGTWKTEVLEMRKAMIEDFYRYRNDPEGYGKMTWAAWFAQNGTAKEPEKPAKQ